MELWIPYHSFLSQSHSWKLLTWASLRIREEGCHWRTCRSQVGMKTAENSQKCRRSCWKMSEHGSPMALTYLSVHHQKLKMRCECLGWRLGAVGGEAQIQLAKDAIQMVTESVQGLFYRLGLVWALHSLWGQKLCLPWLPNGRKKCVPAAPQLRGSEMKGAISIRAFLGILVVQACPVAGWGQGGSCDLQALEKGRKFMQVYTLLWEPHSESLVRQQGMPVKEAGVPCSLGTWCIPVVLSA